MAGLTLTLARAQVRQFIDDVNSRRWTDAQVDAALAAALSSCLIDYASRGGDRFDLETTGTTSASTGLLSLSSTVPLLIRAVVYEPDSTTRYRVQPGGPQADRFSPVLEARALRIFYVREYALPTDSSHPLVGVGATGANTWIDFDQWVCAVAAKQALIKDAEMRNALDAMEETKRRTVMTRQRTPAFRPWPDAVWQPDPCLRWHYAPDTTSIVLGRQGFWL